MDENKVISPHDEPKIICKKCGRERAATKFFKKKTKERIIFALIVLLCI